MMENKRLQRSLYIAILLALTIIMGRFFLIPIPFTHGNINLCDAGIMICAILLGPKAGFFVGGFGGLFLDLISGYGQYMIFSLIVHGLEGLVCGFMFKKYHSKILAVVLASLIMILGYFISDTILYSITVGYLGILANFLQGLVGSLVTVLLTAKLSLQNLKSIK